MGHHGAVGLPVRVGQRVVQHLMQLRFLQLGWRQQLAPEQLCGRGPLGWIVVQQPGDDRFLEQDPGTPVMLRNSPDEQQSVQVKEKTPHFWHLVAAF